MLCHEGGSPERLPGTSRDGLGAVGGQVMQFVVIFGHLFRHLLAPWAPRWPPWELLWRPPGTFCITFVSIPAISAVLQGGRCGWHGCPEGAPRGVQMWILYSKYRCFTKVCVWSPRCPKGIPRGAPGRVFGTFLAPFGAPCHPFRHPWPL